jgi:polysaccharide biosynthesis protein PslG
VSKQTRLVVEQSRARDRIDQGFGGLTRHSAATATLPRVALRQHGRRVLSAIVPLTVVVGAMASAPAPAAAQSDAASCAPVTTKGGLFVGVTAQDLLFRTGTFRDCSLNALARARVGVLREVFYWAGIETSPGVYDFSVQDDYVEAAALRHMRVLPAILWAPKFRSTEPATNPKHGFYPPRDPADMGTFAEVLARRYGPGGTFWQSHPSLPYVPITTWQIWNEPNLRVYWADGPNPAAYSALLKAASDGIHRVDPTAQIVTGGLPYSKDRRTMSPETFLRRMYAAGARGSFNALAVHPYSDTVSRLVVAVARMRRLLNRAGDRTVPIWVTEVGWASGGPPSFFTVGKRRQAQLIGQTVRTLSHRRRHLGVQGLVIYNLRDSRPLPGDHDFWGFHAGLFDLKGRPKPAVRALRSATRGL